jgi:FtsZ-interacting cell division protein ZipA
MPGAQLAPEPRIGSQTLVRIGVVAAVAMVALLLFLAGRRSGTVEGQPAAGTAQSVERTAVEPTAVEPMAAEPGSVATPEGNGSDSASDEVAAASTAPVERAATPTRSTSESAISPRPQREPEPHARETGLREPAAAPARSAPPSDRPAPTATETAAPTPAAATPPREQRSEAERRVRIVKPERPTEEANDAASRELQTAVRVLELPGAVRIELGGIAWSEERPFALVNGRVVGPGDVVESLAVVAIAQRHVELQGEAGHFLLRLK